jgi:transposase
VVVAEAGAEGDVRHFGKIGGDLGSVDRMVRRLRTTRRKLHFVYEAGPCGFHLYRHLTDQGLQCTVVSPSMTPRRSGDRIKTDRRDAAALARLQRAGEHGAIYIPGPDDEAFRGLVRAREDAVASQTRARHRLKALLLRHGYRYAGRAAWTFRYRQWLSKVPHRRAADRLSGVHRFDQRGGTARRAIERRDSQASPPVEASPLVAALQALRGVSLITAVTLVAEIGDITRFHNPRS